MKELFGFFVSFLVYFYLPAKLFLMLFLKKWRFPKTLNYRKETISTGLGLTFPVFHVILTIVFLLHKPWFSVVNVFWEPLSVRLSDMFHIVIFGLPVFVVLVGYYDDTKGQKKIKGLAKNVRSFLSTGCMTSSLLKASVVLLCAFVFSFFKSVFEFDYPSIHRIILDTVLISLATNFFNLLDLRPGRAVKTFVVLCLVLIFHNGFDAPFSDIVIFLFTLPVLASVLAYAPLDFRGEAMMGDAGSNMLGFVLGIGYAVILPLPAKVVVVIFLTLFHIYCEFYSFSDFISRNRVLRWLDEWGTCMKKDRE